MDAAKILITLLLIETLIFTFFYLKDVFAHKEDFKNIKWVPSILIGMICNFFDTLGIGSYATSTTAFKFTKSCRDDLIPGTMNVCYAIPIAIQALVFIQKVEIDPLTLVLMIAASIVGAVVGATYPEMSKILRKLMPRTYFLVPGYGAQGGTAQDLKHCFNEDGLGAIVNSSRGIIAAYKQEKYSKFGPEHFAEASRQAVIDMIADINSVL